MDLAYSCVSDAGLLTLSGLPLTSLDLSYTDISGNFEVLQGSPITSLDLSGTKITDNSLASLHSLQLKRLVLECCYGISSLAGLEGMALSDLSVENCEQLGPEELANFWEGRYREEARLRKELETRFGLR